MARMALPFSSLLVPSTLSHLPLLRSRQERPVVVPTKRYRPSLSSSICITKSLFMQLALKPLLLSVLYSVIFPVMRLSLFSPLPSVPIHRSPPRPMRRSKMLWSLP